MALIDYVYSIYFIIIDSKFVFENRQILVSHRVYEDFYR